MFDQVEGISTNVSPKYRIVSYSHALPVYENVQNLQEPFLQAQKILRKL